MARKFNFMNYDANTHKADYMSCSFCNGVIERKYKKKGKRKIIDRSNRVDCEDRGGKIETYHCVCWERACLAYE
jgi:hypothetical protein